MNFKVERRKLTPEEYTELRRTTGWDVIGQQAIEIALTRDLFSVCVYDKDRLAGMGRVVGDGAIYFYIQDVIVKPQYRHLGIGTQIMKEIEEYLTTVAGKNAFVGLMAAEGVEHFYKKLGYQRRPPDRPGMYKVVR